MGSFLQRPPLKKGVFFCRAKTGERVSRLLFDAPSTPGHSLQKPAHRVELRSETRPVSGFQAIDRSIVVVECLARPIRYGAREWRSQRNTRGRWRGAVCEERRQCPGERLLHYHMIPISGDHALELRQLSLFRPQIERRYAACGSVRGVRGNSRPYRESVVCCGA
jgi:hypothetical protein